VSVGAWAMKTVAGALPFLLIGCARPAVTGKVSYEVTTNRLLTRWVLVPKDQFTAPRLETTAREFLAEVSRKYSFGRLLLATDEQDFGPAWGHPVTDLTAAGWLSLYEKQKKAPFPVAVVTVVGKECALQVRDKSGAITKLTLTDRDPLIMTSRTGQYEFLHLTARYVEKESLETEGDRVTVHAFLEAKSDPGVVLDPELWLSLSKILGTRALSVAVRPDHWFVDHSDFPVLYPFRVPAVNPDALGEIGLRPSSWCFGDFRGLHCGLATTEDVKYVDYDFDGKRR
jgi:hypothetical protein